MNTQVLVLAKYPTEGQVKTRLASEIGARKATLAYKWMLDKTLNEVESTELDSIVFLDPAERLEQFSVEYRGSYRVLPQAEGDLGPRLAHACMEGAAGNAEAAVVIIGTDCLSLKSHHLREAGRALQKVDAVLGPAEDGGYYLMGLSNQELKRQRKLGFPIFQDIAWSTEVVFEQTMAVFLGLGIELLQLETLRDIDTLADLLASSAGRELLSTLDVEL